MTEIDFNIAGRKFYVACEKGQEEYVTKLTQELDKRAQQLTDSNSNISDSQKFVIIALALLDELNEKNNQNTKISEKNINTLKNIASSIEILAKQSQNR